MASSLDKSLLLVLPKLDRLLRLDHLLRQDHLLNLLSQPRRQGSEESLKGVDDHVVQSTNVAEGVTIERGCCMSFASNFHFFFFCF